MQNSQIHNLLTKLALIFFGVLIPSYVFASGGHGEGEAGGILMMYLLSVLLLTGVLSFIVPTSHNYSKILFISSVFLFAIWSSWLFYYGFVAYIGQTLFVAKGGPFPVLKLLITLLGFLSLFLPLIYLGVFLIFRKYIVSLLESNSRQIYSFIYIWAPIFLLSLFLVAIFIRRALFNSMDGIFDYYIYRPDLGYYTSLGLLISILFTTFITGLITPRNLGYSKSFFILSLFFFLLSSSYTLFYWVFSDIINHFEIGSSERHNLQMASTLWFLLPTFYLFCIILLRRYIFSALEKEPKITYLFFISLSTILYIIGSFFVNVFLI